MGRRSVPAEGMEAIGQAELLLGAPRLLNLLAAPEQATCAAYLPDAVGKVVRESPLNRFAVLVSGDTRFLQRRGKTGKRAGR
jgi:precorrin-6B methylase 1